MTEVADETLTDLCKRLEAFETPKWAIAAVLDVEVTTEHVFDPCAGLGAISWVCNRLGKHVTSIDIVDWEKHFPDLYYKRFSQPYGSQHRISCWPQDFFQLPTDLSDFTVIMNPPFSLAEAFVDKARELGARKIICFQRQAWRESIDRRGWWEANSPARVWVCGARAACWRFDLLDCQHPEGEASCPNFKRKGKKHETQGCHRCMGSTPTSYAWYVWERGHKGAEVTSAIYPRGDAT